jgi:hypothetical protein
LGFDSVNAGCGGALDGTYKLRNRSQHLATMAEQHTDLLEVLVRQVMKD